jgi:A/G-specific adenine glycosylase
MTPADRPGDYAQAMMDLGATICRPRQPDCCNCPLASECLGYASGTPESFPAPKEKRVRPHRHGVAWWIERDGCIWLVRRPEKGMLGGMAALPGPDWTSEPPDFPSMAAVTHGFTHFTLELHVARKGELDGEGWWHPLNQIGNAGLPTLYAKAIEMVLSKRCDIAA